MSDTKRIEADLRELGNKGYASRLQRFFKTGKGEYGEGDLFLGIKVPVVRAMVRKHVRISITDILQLLNSPYHEIRLFALLTMVKQFNMAGDDVRQQLFRHYLDHTRFINNWDLVDSSAHHIVGAWLADRNRSVLYDLARSESLWERRISIISTLHFINQDDFNDTLKIAELLLSDSEDLIHKASGWMLREIGNRDRAAEETFLKDHFRTMPRTMLRYSIEKFPEPLRQKYLKGCK